MTGLMFTTGKVHLKKIENNKIIAWKRKCDFDLEIGLDCFEGLEKYDGFIFFSGDGDNVPQPKAEGVISFVYNIKQAICQAPGQNRH